MADATDAFAVLSDQELQLTLRCGLYSNFKCLLGILAVLCAVADLLLSSMFDHTDIIICIAPCAMLVVLTRQLLIFMFLTCFYANNSFLPPESLLMLQLGCRRLKEPARRDSLWSAHCQRDWALSTPLRSAT
jgi:hypothetical protein